MSVIAHVTAPGQFGGLERVVAGLASASASRGHRVVLVMTLEPGHSVPAWAQALEPHGVLLRPLAIANRDYLGERRAVRMVLRDVRAKVVHTHGYRSDVLSRAIAHGLGLPALSTAHGFASTGGVGRLYEWLQVRAWRRFDAVVAVSAPLMERLRSAGVPESRLVLIRNGVTASSSMITRNEARARMGLDTKAPIVGWVGRMSDEKDPVLALEAFGRTVTPGAQLVMIGDGALRLRCEDRARTLGIADRVRMEGARSDAPEVVSAFDALILSSRTEGTPMVILEAAMAGVPVVATAVGGVPDMLGSEGRTTPPGDADGLARALDETLQDRDASSVRAERLRARLRDVAMGEDWVAKYLDLYARLTHRPRLD